MNANPVSEKALATSTEYVKKFCIISRRDYARRAGYAVVNYFCVHGDVGPVVWKFQEMVHKKVCMLA